MNIGIMIITTDAAAHRMTSMIFQVPALAHAPLSAIWIRITVVFMTNGKMLTGKFPGIRIMETVQ
jgi:hypothetical protein